MKIAFAEQTTTIRDNGAPGSVYTRGTIEQSSIDPDLYSLLHSFVRDITDAHADGSLVGGHLILTVVEPDK